jgi:hypothetical protein
MIQFELWREACDWGEAFIDERLWASIEPSVSAEHPGLADDLSRLSRNPDDGIDIPVEDEVRSVMNLLLLVEPAPNDVAYLVVDAWAKLPLEQRCVPWFSKNDSAVAAVCQLLSGLDGDVDLIDVSVPAWLPELCGLVTSVDWVRGERVVWRRASTPLGSTCLADVEHEGRYLGRSGISSCPLWIEPGRNISPSGAKFAIGTLRRTFERVQRDEGLCQVIAGSSHDILEIDAGIQRLEELVDQR